MENMEYEAVIGRILEAERSARELTRQSREKEARLAEDIARDAQEERRRSMAWAEGKLEELRRETAERREEELRREDRWTAEAMSRIERAYAHYGENWVDTLFRQIVETPS